MDFEISPRARDVRERVQRFFDEEILPRNREWRDWTVTRGGDPDWLPALREAAKAQGLWNLGIPGLPEDKPGQGLSNLDFAPAAEIMGRLIWAPTVFNCHAPDLPNMITLLDGATPAQEARWLDPLLEGRVRSGFAMTEPDVASADARNISMRIEKTRESYRLNGLKWFASGAGHEDCAFLIVIGVLEGSAARAGHTALIAPMDAPGLRITRELRFMGWNDPMGGIAELDFTDVEVPHDALLGEEGRGFAVAQTRLGPARVHHCMRAIGLAEAMVEMMVARAAERRAFNRSLDEFDTVQGWIARSRVEIEQARLIVLKAAWLLDRDGHGGAWREVSIAKVAVPSMLQRIADRAVQLFGALGGTDDAPLHSAYAWARAFRIFDGPDEVHLRQIFKQEPPARAALRDNPYMWPPRRDGL